MAAKENSEVSTVNVIEFSDGSPTDISTFKSYQDTPEGNELAEERFVLCMLEHGGEPEETAAAIEEGVFEGEDNYMVLITHST